MTGLNFALNAGNYTQTTDSGEVRYPDKTMSEKEWKKYLKKVDTVIDDLAEIAKEDAKANLKRCDEERTKNREEWLKDAKEQLEQDTVIVKQKVDKDFMEERGILVNAVSAVESEEIIENLVTKTTIKSEDNTEYGELVEKVKLMKAEEKTVSTKKTVPYSEFEKNGVIEYNGVIFSCNEEENSISLGDMSNPNDVINIPLENGGCLKVNRNSIGALGQAIGMFSPKDVGAIMRAIAEDAKIHSTQKDIEDEENDTIEDMVSNQPS